jgi:hypothetical protein
VQSFSADDTPNMPELLISFRRPPSLAQADLYGWFASQDRALAALSGRLEAGATTSHAAETDPSLLRVSLPAGRGRSADDRITELLADMRMLGLNPQIVAPDDRAPRPPTSPLKGSDGASPPPRTRRALPRLRGPA